MTEAPAQPQSPMFADAELSAPVEAEQAVSPLELFFDLVFVLALTQVTALLAADPTPHGLVRGMLILAILWWGWVGYAWLTDCVDVDEGGMRLAYLTAMATMLVASLTVPTAFTTDAMVFALAYFAFRTLHVVIYERSTRAMPQVNRAVRRLGPLLLVSSALIVVGALFDGSAQIAIWAFAITLDYASPLMTGSDGWQISPGHFAERHGLIIIIALGESIVAIGAGGSSGNVTLQIVVAAVMGVAVAGALWWMYFDVVAIVAARRLREATDVRRNAMARDSYSYLHLPMIAGIVLLALGLKKTLAHPDGTLTAIPAIALCGGVALYLLAHIAFRLRNVGSLNRQRLAAAAVCLALIPLALRAEALVALAALLSVLVALIGYETVRFREARARIRTEAR